MKLRRIDFGNVLGASGVQGFFGEGYWFHKIWKPFGLDFAGMTFVSKTATLLPHEGNMPLTRRHTPKNLFPGCIRVKWRRGAVLNSVELSNPGLGTLLATGKWQKRAEPFLISIMSIADDPKKRREEISIIVETLRLYKENFRAPFGLQINFSCPNAEQDLRQMIADVSLTLDTAGALDVPLMPKFSIASAPINVIQLFDKHPFCDAICVSNTLPFGWEKIDWNKIWGSNKSPLEKLGGGGLSGKTLQPLVCEWITRLRNVGFDKPINGGGGVLCPEDVRRYHKAGASSIFLGSVAIVRPWRVKAIIEQANNLVWRQ